VINTGASTFSTEEATADLDFGNDEIHPTFGSFLQSIALERSTMNEEEDFGCVQEGIGSMPIHPIKEEPVRKTAQTRPRRPHGGFLHLKKK